MLRDWLQQKSGDLKGHSRQPWSIWVPGWGPNVGYWLRYLITRRSGFDSTKTNGPPVLAAPSGATRAAGPECFEPRALQLLPQTFGRAIPRGYTPGGSIGAGLTLGVGQLVAGAGKRSADKARGPLVVLLTPDAFKLAPAP